MTKVKNALELALGVFREPYCDAPLDDVIKACDEALASLKQEQGEPVAWLIGDKNINHIEIRSIQRLIRRAKHAHMTDIKLRINGQDEWYEGDWIKHMVEAPQPKQEQGEPVSADDFFKMIADKNPNPFPPQQRKPLTNKQLFEHWQVAKVSDMTHAEIDIADYVLIARDVEALHNIKE